MIELQTFIGIGLAFFVIAVSPGPANIANAMVAMEFGKAASFRFSIGLTAGIALWGLVAVTGLGAVLQGSVYVLSVLKVIGGMYLLWLAWNSARSALAPEPATLPLEGRRSYVRNGFLLNVSNPKTVVAWMAALTVGLDADASIVSLAMGYAVCVFVAFCVNIGYMSVFSIDGVMAIYRRIRRTVGMCVAGLFAIAGVGLVRSAFVR